MRTTYDGPTLKALSRAGIVVRDLSLRCRLATIRGELENSAAYEEDQGIGRDMSYTELLAALAYTEWLDKHPAIPIPKGCRPVLQKLAAAMEDDKQPEDASCVAWIEKRLRKVR